MLNLFAFQEEAIEKLNNGSILWGAVGSGKSITSIVYYYVKECQGSIKPYITSMKNPKDLYIITTARKRDSLDWERECSFLSISKDFSINQNNVKFVVDSWNNIGKYIDVKDAFFIFDEQRVIGSGSWVKSFLKIVKNNRWILLTATPGDTWSDYIPVFIANGFYKNKTEFLREHVVYNNFTKFPKIDHYVGISKLLNLQKRVLVKMNYQSKVTSHKVYLLANYDREKFNKVYKERWNIYKNAPIKESGEACYIMRKVVNSDDSRIEILINLIQKHSKLIVFYNFDYELEILRKLGDSLDFPIAEYNGHLHEDIPQSEKWIYLVQYTSASEAWNCIETNAILFYSLNYSYRITAQASGRIDRMNTPFAHLFYYYIHSISPIDSAILEALKNKKDFNETSFLNI